MADLSQEKLKEVAESFRVVRLMAETIAAAVAEGDDIQSAQIFEDAAIIAFRIGVAQIFLEEAYPGFGAMVLQADREATRRAARHLLTANFKLHVVK